MKRKIKKFSDGGMAAFSRSLTMAPGGGGDGGGLAGLQKSSLDIAQGTGMLEQGIQRIKGTNSPGLYRQLGALGKTMTGSSPSQSDTSYPTAAMPYQMSENARPLQSSLGFKKGGTVKAKPKATKSTSKRGDGIARRGKTRGKMV